MLTASERARAEADYWAEIAGHWRQADVPELWADRPPTEKDVVIFYDPSEDIARKGGDWGHDVEDDDLSSLALFAAALAVTEADAWEDSTLDVATRAYESRKFLLGDRIAPWAIPWLDTVGRCYPRYREQAHLDRDLLLRLANEARIAPRLPGSEGIFMKGEDSYGPVDPGVHWPEWTGSLWSGAVVLGENPSSGRVDLFEDAVRRWANLGAEHAGSAQLWLDLSERAARTATKLRSED